MTAPGPGQPAPFGQTPNAERYVLAAESLRRRQLRAALLHGSHLTWRERRRIWPAAIAGASTAAVIVAVIAVVGAFHQQQRVDEQQRRERQQPRPPAVSATTVSPSATVRR